MKKVLSIVLAVCLLLTALPVSASAAKADEMTDVSHNWAYNAINYCLENGLMSGVGNNRFNPSGTVTRAQVAQVLYTKAGEPSVSGLENPFTDVKQADWFYNAVVWCRANSVVNGTSATTFTPTRAVTREQLCTMVYGFFRNYLGKTPVLKKEGEMRAFADWGKASSYAQAPIRWAVGAGFMSGTSGSTLAPGGTAIRAQLAQFLVNLDELLADQRGQVSLSANLEPWQEYVQEEIYGKGVFDQDKGGIFVDNTTKTDGMVRKQTITYYLYAVKDVDLDGKDELVLLSDFAEDFGGSWHTNYGETTVVDYEPSASYKPQGIQKAWSGGKGFYESKASVGLFGSIDKQLSDFGPSIQATNTKSLVVKTRGVSNYMNFYSDVVFETVKDVVKNINAGYGTTFTSGKPEWSFQISNNGGQTVHYGTYGESQFAGYGSVDNSVSLLQKLDNALGNTAGNSVTLPLYMMDGVQYNSVEDKPIPTPTPTPTPTPSPSPVPPADPLTPGPEVNRVISINCMGRHSVLLKPDGTVDAVGDNSEGQLDVRKWSNITKIAAGGAHSVGLRADGTVVATGKNGYGQCNVTGWMDVIDVFAGDDYTIGLLADGTAVAVGRSGSGVDVSNWRGVTDVAAGDTHALGLRADGTVVATGGAYRSFAEGVENWSGITDIAAGKEFSVGLQSDGTLVATGYNTYHQLDVENWRDMIAVAAGGFHTVGLRRDGRVFATGDNSDGQCDVGEWTDIVAVYAGRDFTVGLKSDGTVVATGANSNGECNVEGWVVRLPGN